ncbi:MAG: DUF929 domain-containing protein [Candidatus Marsarchaeota archaeon]|nr:DUF929 domain-containing protein [Candidatus Marsarchaeota archaeon]
MNKRTLAYVIIALVIIAAVVAAVFLNSGVSSSQLVKYDNAAVPQATLTQLSSIANNMSLANSVGVGSAGAAMLPGASGASMLTLNGLPEVLYIGADYCPYCAATRWGLIIALMRFGNFSSLHYMTSSASDYDPSTSTFTFYNSSYTSGHVSFVGVEAYTNYVPSGASYYATLQTPTQSEGAIFNKYDTNNTLLPANARGGIPFVDFGNLSVEAGALVLPDAFYKHSWSQIISSLGDSGTQQSQAAIGAANIYTAAICRMTNNTPSSVCDQQFVKAAASFLG